MEKHSVVIENREKISITDVKSVDTFDEEQVCADLAEGGLVIKGKRLHIQVLDLDKGEACVCGEIISVNYVQSKAEKSVLRKIFK